MLSRRLLRHLACVSSALAVTLLPLGRACAQTQTFPVANPGFEGTYNVVRECANITGAVAPGWGDNTCWDGARPIINYARDAVNPHGGSASQKITLVSGNRVQFAQFLGVPTEAGKRNIISYWMRAQAPMYATVMLRQSNAPYAVYASKLMKLGTAWQRYEFEALTRTEDTGLFILADKPGTFWIDDFDMQTAATTEANPSPPSGTVPRVHFGMHFNQADTPWPQVGNAIGAVRIWDAGGNKNGSGVAAQWSEINGASGSYDWSGLDARVAAAAARGADVLYTLGGRTPQWAALQPNASSPYGPGQCSEPKADQVWQDWVRAIGTRYKGKIKHWEIWNEADLPDFYCGTPERLASLTQQAHSVLKQIDPANQVLSPSLAGFGGPGLLDFLFAQGAGAYIDIVSYHFYVDQPEEAVVVRVPNVKALMRRYGLQSKPLWNTEQGWIEIPNPAPIPQATAVAYVARSYILPWAYGVSRFYYYTWDNQWNQFAFTQPDRTTLTSAGVAYREVAAWMTGKTMQSLSIESNGVYIATLRDAANQAQRILWHPKQSVQFTLPSAWGATRQRDLAGTVADLSGRTSVSVGPAPVLLEGEASPPPPGATAIGANPPSVAAGASTTVSWSGIKAPAPTNWIGLYRPGAASQDHGGVWMYVSCSKTPNFARASGSCPFPIPAGIASGSYELRLHAAASWTAIAKTVITVTSGVAGTTLNLSPSTIARGGTVAVSWSGITQLGATNWIGLYKPGATSQDHGGNWIYVSCNKTPSVALASGSCPFVIPATLTPGSYEMRLHAPSSWTPIAASNALSVQ
jgi:hypothetical protein